MARGPFQQRNGEYSDPTRDKLGKPGVSHPTPNIDDYIIVEVIPLEKGQYRRLPYGTPHGEFPAAKLISQRRTNGDDNKVNVTRVYATARQNQDAYNASIAYTAQSGAHRILTRSLLVFRDADPDKGIPRYEPLDAFTPDSQFPSAVLVDESAQPAEEPYNTLYLRVTRIFEDFGTRAQQDAWNLIEGTTFPYVSDLYPRLVRRYRFPANAVPTLTIGSTTDTAYPAAKLLTKLPSNESAPVVVILATFEAVPTTAELAALGGAGSDGLGITVAFEEGDNAFPVVTWKRRVPVGDYAAAANNEACPLPGFSTLVLTDQGRTPSQDSATVAIEMRVYQILPGKIITSDDDAARLPRTLTPIPAYYLNGDRIVTTKQKVPYLSTVNGVVVKTPPDAVTNTLLSSKVEATTSLMAVKINISRANVALPLVELPLMVDRVDGAAGKEYRTVVSVDPVFHTDGTPDVETTRTNLDAAVGNAVTGAIALVGTLFNVIDYSVQPLSPTQVELRYTAVVDFPELFGAEYNANIPERFLAPYNLTTVQDWVDTTSVGNSGQMADLLDQAGNNGEIVVSCKITPVTQYRGKRVTVLLPEGISLPLTLNSKRLNEGTGQVESIEEKFGAEAALPLPSPIPATTTTAKLEKLGDGKAIRTLGTVPGYALLKGQEPDRKLGIALPYTTQIKDANDSALATLMGNPEVEITPKGELLVEVKTSTLDAATITKLTAYKKEYAATVDRINFPDVLTAMNVEWETSIGKGDSTETGESTLNGSGSLQLTLPESAQASATLIPNVAPVIQSIFAENVPATDMVFFVPDGTSYAAVLAKAGAQPWPVFQPVSHTFVCKGQKVSVRAQASARMAISLSKEGNSTAASSGSGGDQDTTSVTRTVTTKPTIHGALSVGGSISTAPGGTPTFTPHGGFTNLPPGTALSGTTSLTSLKSTATAKATATIVAPNATATRTVTLTANGSVSPTTLGKTPGHTAIPSTGVYAYRVNVESYGGGYSIARVRKINFAELRAGTGGATPLTIATATATGDTTLHTDGAQLGVAGDDDAATPLAELPSIDPTDATLAPPPTYTPPAQVPGANPTNGGNGNGPSSSTSAPIITIQPASITVDAGTSATFSVVATGTGLSYQWYLGTVGGGALLAGATASTFIISAVSSGDAGPYYAVVSNAAGQTTTQAGVLTVGVGSSASAIVITSQPTSIVLPLNKGGQLTVAATGGTGTLHYQWYFRNVNTGGTFITGGYGTSASTTATQNVSEAGLQYANGTTDFKVTIHDDASHSVTSDIVTATSQQPSIIAVSQPSSGGQYVFSAARPEIAIKLSLDVPLPLSETFTFATSGTGVFKFFDGVSLNTITTLDLARGVQNFDQNLYYKASVADATQSGVSIKYVTLTISCPTASISVPVFFTM